MSFIPYRRRKLAQIFILTSLFIIQGLVFVIWYFQNKSEEKLSKNIENIISPNKILLLTDKTKSHYFNAQNYFNEYLNSYNPEALKNYKNSLDNMSVYLDSLNEFSKKDIDFNSIISSKHSRENQIINIRKRLDSIIKNGITPITAEKIGEFEFKKYDFEKVLRTITYDTIRISDAVLKRGMLARIGQAILGKYDIKKEELQLYINMSFDNGAKIGTIENQMENIFLSTDKFYNSQFKKLKHTYYNLKDKDQKLIFINKEILEKSQEILDIYNASIQEFDLVQQQKIIKQYQENSSTRKQSIIILMALMVVGMILLLLLTKVSFDNEKRISKAKLSAEKNLEFKNRLIGMLSHEVRAPLHIISNLSEKIQQNNKDNSLRPDINSLHFTANSLLITANQILDFSKNENRKITAYNTKVNLYYEINSILDSLQSLAENKGIVLNRHLELPLQEQILIDSGKIHQLFYNLIGNSLKFTDKGSISVFVATQPHQEKTKIDVTIKDTGIGIPEGELQKVFNTYYQVNTSSKQISLGAGLGLSLCREIINLYQGEITINSKVNQGTEITFSLIVDKLLSNHETNEQKITKLSKKIKNAVVVVDDDSIMLSIVAKLLKDVNFEVKGFNTYNSAKNYLENNDASLLITDINLPDDSGINFTRETKTSHNQTPIIFLTGDDYFADTYSESINANQIITKPIHKAELYDAILKALS